MRTAITAAAAATALLSACSFASADGLGWSGFYVGLETGIAQNVVTLNGSFPGPFTEKQSDTGALFGAFAGYDHQVSNWVFGGLVDADYVGTNDLVFGGKAGTHYDLDWIATARVRAGFLPSEKLLLYGTGGVALAGASSSFFFGDLDSTRVGYVVGAGAEYRIDQNWSLKGEFLHHNFGNVISSMTSDYTFKPVVNTGKIGLTYRF